MRWSAGSHPGFPCLLVLAERPPLYKWHNVLLGGCRPEGDPNPKPNGGSLGRPFSFQPLPQVLASGNPHGSRLFTNADRVGRVPYTDLSFLFSNHSVLNNRVTRGWPRLFHRFPAGARALALPRGSGMGTGIHRSKTRRCNAGQTSWRHRADESKDAICDRFSPQDVAKLRQVMGIRNLRLSDVLQMCLA
jgi:hypothetical protein